MPCSVRCPVVEDAFEGQFVVGIDVPVQCVELKTAYDGFNVATTELITAIEEIKNGLSH